MAQPTNTKVEVKQAIPEYYLLNAQVGIPTADGSIQLNKDKEALYSYFITYVNPNTQFFTTLEEKIAFLLRENYLDAEVFLKYSLKQIKALYKQAHSFKYRFTSFTSAHKFYEQYALKNREGTRFLGRFEDIMVWTSMSFADGDFEVAQRYVRLMMSRAFTPATPTLLNIGRNTGGEKTSCFLLAFQDNLPSIRRVKADGEALSALGGGVSFNLINVRETLAPIRGRAGLASGVVPIAKILEDIGTYANQGGVRDGAFAIYSSVFHPDVFQVLAVKKENADEKIRMKTISVGIVCPDKYYELLSKGEMMYQFSPYDVEREYGMPFSKFPVSERYQELVDNPNVTKYQVDPRDIEEEITKLQQESGYPFRLNIDIANRANPIAGSIDMSNICTEILQSSIPQVVNRDLSLANNLGQDIACNLGSTVVRGMMEAGKLFGEFVELEIRALTYVSEDLDVAESPTIQQGNDANHAVGLGVMGLHSYFATHAMMYGDEESLDFTNIYFMTLRYHALRASNKIAQERGKTFDSFKESSYADGSYFDDYLTKFDLEPKTDKVKELFAEIDVPAISDWLQLRADIIKFGLFNSYTLAVAPTGSISYVMNETPSISPIVSRVEERQEKQTGKTYNPAPYLSDETLPYYVSAYDMSMLDMINVHAVATVHVDQGISMSTYFRSEMKAGNLPWKPEGGDLTTRDLTLVNLYAYHKGIKTVYYTRQYSEDTEGKGKETTINECSSCAV